MRTQLGNVRCDFPLRTRDSAVTLVYDVRERSVSRCPATDICRLKSGPRVGTHPRGKHNVCVCPSDFPDWLWFIGVWDYWRLGTDRNTHTQRAREKACRLLRIGVCKWGICVRCACAYVDNMIPETSVQAHVRHINLGSTLS